MRKRTIINLSIVSIVVSVIYILISYYGFDRYISLHFAKEETYIKNYSKLDKADKKNRIIVSLTTTPVRLDKLKPTILSLLDQTVQINEIAISIPYGKKYILPKYLKNISVIYRYAIDYGDAGNLVPTILREREGDTKIILVGDNMIYGKDFIERIVEASDKNPNKVIAVNDLNYKTGILVKPNFFDETLTECNEKNCIGWLKKKLNNDVKIIEYSETYKSWK